MTNPISTVHEPSCLDAASRAVEALINLPDRPRLPGDGFPPPIPPRPVEFDELKRLLLTPATPPTTRDTVWGWLVRRAQVELNTPRRDPSNAAGQAGARWTVIGIGLALPGLRAAAHRWARLYGGEAGDIDSEVLTGFLTALATADPTTENLAGRLIAAGSHAAQRLWRREIRTVLTPESFDWETRLPTHPFGHPDLVLHRAVASGVITAVEADLISATRLGTTPLTVAAKELGLATNTGRRARREAEQRLVTWLTSTLHTTATAPRLPSIPPRPVRFSAS
jgi:hypothetical protein